MPGTRCCVLTCNNSMNKTKRAGLNVSYHRFPKDTSIRKVWIIKCKRVGSWNPNTSYVCSQHFLVDDFERDLQSELLGNIPKNMLKTSSVPSVNLPSSTSITIARMLTKKKISSLGAIKQIESMPSTSTQGEIKVDYKNLFIESQKKILECHRQIADLKKSEANLLLQLQVAKDQIQCQVHSSTLRETPSEMSNTAMKIESSFLPEGNMMTEVDVKEELLDSSTEEIIKSEIDIKDNDILTDSYGYAATVNEVRGLEDIEDESNEFHTTQRSLSIHMRYDIGENPYTCNICNKSFSARSTLNMHIRCHTGQKDYKCDDCNKSFYRYFHLKRHVKTHMKETLLKCYICKKTLSRNDHLKAHLRSHTGQKLLKCDICSMSFYRRSNLKDHIKTHTREKPFKCDICNKTFSSRQYLKVHIASHTFQK